MTTHSFPTLLNQKEVSKIIRKSEAWLERQRWLGEGIPYRKVGRNVFYEESDVHGFLEGQPRIQNKTQLPYRSEQDELKVSVLHQ
tara:strand:- start:586 stop:840 length:255 start_codon:yes stop_codon:yes gene_type:complete